MKKIIFMLAMVIANYVIYAQVKTPASSPKSVLNQVVGLTDVTIDYSRPSAKGRSVFGNLVPFGKLWRTGANANSTVSFSEDVVIWKGAVAGTLEERIHPLIADTSNHELKILSRT